MALEVRGELTGKGKYAIVVARYNESITKNLLDGALRTFAEH